ncbi:MAG: DsbA family protein [bacterium]|nr:DsbA family protein [bacterium]
MKRVVIIVLIVAVAILGLNFLSKSSEDKVNNDPNNKASATQSGIEARSFGTGPVEVVEYADFQCPGCASFFPVVSQVKEANKDKITFKFKHFPLQTIHPNARAAHRAAQAAANQGKFWELHDLLYQNQTSWNNSTNAAGIFETFAGQIGLDMERYQADVASSDTNSVINADVAEAGTKNVTGTPTFFIDGKEISVQDLQTVEAFTKKIDEAFAAKQQ